MHYNSSAFSLAEKGIENIDPLQQRLISTTQTIEKEKTS